MVAILRLSPDSRSWELCHPRDRLLETRALACVAPSYSWLGIALPRLPAFLPGALSQLAATLQVNRETLLLIMEPAGLPVPPLLPRRDILLHEKTDHFNSENKTDATS